MYETRKNWIHVQKLLQVTWPWLWCKRHNFCIDQDGEEYVDESVALREILPLPGADLGCWGYLPTVEPLVHIPGSTQIRDIIVRRVSNLAMRRPAENVERHRYELHDVNLM
jgi:hypothetical protein